MYAIVKAGGHQEKVEVGDVILVNRLNIMKYKNKTGVTRRKGHRQKLTAVKITAIA